MKKFSFSKSNNGEKPIFASDFKPMIWTISLNTVGFFFLSVILPIFTFEISSSGLLVGLVTSSQVGGGMFSSFIAGFLVDRVKNKRKIVIFGSFGRAFAYIFIYIALCNNHIIGVIIGTFILGFMASFFWVPFDVLIAEKSHKNNRSEAYGKRNLADGVGQMIGAGIGLLFYFSARNISNPYLYLGGIPFFALSNIVAAAVFFKKVDESIKISSANDSDKDRKTEIVKEKKIVRSFLIGIIFLFAIVLMNSINASLARPHVLNYITLHIESDIVLVSLAFFPAGLLATVLSPKIGRIVEKISPIAGLAIISFAGALITYLLIHIPNVWLFSLIILLDFTFGTVGILIFQNFMSRINLENRGKIVGINSTISNLGGIIGPVLGGLAWGPPGSSQERHQLPFIISIFVEICLIPLYLVVAYFLLPHIEEKYEE